MPHISILAISFCEYVISQANALSKLGYQVLIVNPTTLINQTLGAELENLLQPGVEICQYEPSDRKKLGFYNNLYKKISDHSPNLLHIHENGELETLFTVLCFPRIPVILTVHDVTTHPGQDSSLNLRRRFIKFFLRYHARSIHVHGKNLKSVYFQKHKTSSKRCHVIPHGELALFSHWEKEKINKEPYTCLFFGRMEKYRGLDNLVEVGKLLRQRLPEIRIIVAGTGSELPKYRTIMADLAIFEIHDHFIPNRDVYKFFRRASLLLLPYHEASQSGVISIGIHFGLPAVAFDVGSLSEIIEDSVHGQIITAGDIEAFASAVIKILTNRQMQSQMTINVSRLSDQLSFDTLAPQFDALYKRNIKQLERMAEFGS